MKKQLKAYMLVAGALLFLTKAATTTPNTKFMAIKIIYSISLLSFAFVAKGQSEKLLDHAYLECQYEHTWQFDTLENVVRNDLLILQIGKNVSKTFSYYTYQSDSLNNAPDGEMKKIEMTRKAVKEYIEKGYTNSLMYKRFSTYLYKNYPQGKITATDRFALKDYIYEDELNTQFWQILDSTEAILDYPCQMAECNFRGRQWTAWFAPDIPISDGPWKFGGLPGLIMEVYDKGNQYHFKIIGLEKTEEPIVFSETYVGSKKFEKTNRIEFLKSKKRYLMDMSGYIEMETGIDLSDGTPPKIMRYDLIERDYQ